MQEESIFTAGSKVPFYRTRMFWVVVYLIFLIVATIGFLLTDNNVSGKSILFLGGLYPYMFGGVLLGAMGAMVFLTAYCLLQLFLIYKTFSTKLVNLTYPTISLIVYLLGFFVPYILL